MWPELIASLPILFASFLGSTHCAGMCGGFVAIYSSSSRQNLAPHILYNSGRLITYIALGVLASVFGKRFDLISGIANISSITVGALLILFGIIQLTSFRPRCFVRAHDILTNVTSFLARPVFSLPSQIRPLLIGMVTTLLPCGWLYVFVALALGSADPIHAALIMFFFWIGTVPVMAMLGIAGAAFLEKLRLHFPRMMPVLLIVSGCISLGFHLAHSHHSDHSDHSHHHQGH